MIATPVSRKSDIVVQEFENEILIYDLNINKAFCLNQTSALIYQLCDGKHTIPEISDLMSVKLKTIVSEELVWLAINELKKNNLLENSKEISTSLQGISRREVAKKVGFASLIALPIISSVVAPNATMAASAPLLALYSSCSAPGQCQTGNCTTGSMLCCVPGVNSFADGSDICAAPGTCASFNTFCCSGPVVDLGVGPCGGAGTYCFCA